MAARLSADSLMCAFLQHSCCSETAISLTTKATLLKFEEKVAYSVRIRRWPAYEECVRSVAAKRNGINPPGKRSGSPATGGSAALRRKRSPVRHDEIGSAGRGKRSAGHGTNSG